MKKITYKMLVKDAYHKFSEEIVAIVEDAITEVEHVKGLLEYFNKTLKPGETKRHLVLLRKINNNKEARLDHEWKKESLVTEKGGYDRYKCSRCKITGKRYGLSNYIKIDKKFEKKVYCKIL
jgi:hypothetical protein